MLEHPVFCQLSAVTKNQNSNWASLGIIEKIVVTKTKIEKLKQENMEDSDSCIELVNSVFCILITPRKRVCNRRKNRTYLRQRPRSS